MIYTKNNPVGIDVPIQRVQQIMYDKMVNKFNCEINAYGRIYKVDDKPLYFDNGNYIDLLTNSKIKGLHFFFVEGDKSDVVVKPNVMETDVDIIFMIDDMSKVRADIQHYADEEIVVDTKSFLKGYGLEIDSIEKNEKALSEFDFSKIKFTYPFFIFKIKTTIKNY